MRTLFVGNFVIELGARRVTIADREGERQLEGSYPEWVQALELVAAFRPRSLDYDGAPPSSKGS